MTVSHRQFRVNSFLQPRVKRVLNSMNQSVREPRSRRGRRPGRSLARMLRALFFGLLACDKALRRVEERTEEADNDDGTTTAGRIPDTTLGDLLAKLDPTDFEAPLVRQVRDMNRRNELAPVGLPCGIATVDGKDLGKLTHDAEGLAIRQSDGHGGAFWHVRVLRSVLSSAAGKPCIGQRTIPGREGEITNFPAFATWLHETYGRHGLFEILDVDAGFMSRAAFKFVDQALGYGLVVGLKENQPELYREAERVLGRLVRKGKPEWVTPWEHYQGTLMRRSLYRTAELDGYLDWKNLRQVWLVVQETATPPEDGKAQHRAKAPGPEWTVETELRYFASNLLWNRLSPQQILLVVRNHWCVENDCFHSLDMQWGEDRPAWCGRGRSVVVLGWLRMLAYNVVQRIRKCHVMEERPRKGDRVPLPWGKTFRLVGRFLDAFTEGLGAGDTQPPERACAG